jgi:copper resistance protein C
MNRYSKTLATTTVATMLSVGSPTSAHHQFLEQALPTPGSHTSTVSEVKLRFEGNADALFSTIKLMNADGSVVAASTQPRASREMVMSTPSLPPGPYLVEYRALTTDGDVVKGDFFLQLMTCLKSATTGPGDALLGRLNARFADYLDGARTSAS